MELDELADNTMLAKHLRDSQHHIGCGGAIGERSGEPEADHLGDEHEDRLSDHDRLGFDAADSPTEDADPVDHGGVAVRPYQAVGI